MAEQTLDEEASGMSLLDTVLMLLYEQLLRKSFRTEVGKGIHIPVVYLSDIKEMFRGIGAESLGSTKARWVCNRRHKGPGR